MFAGILKKVSIRKYLLYFGTILNFNPIILIPLFHPCFIWTPLVCISSLADLYSFQTAFSSVLLIYFLLLKKTQRYTMSCFPKLSAVTNKCWSPGATHRAAALPNPCVCVCVCVCVAAGAQCLFKLSGLWVMSLNDDCGACRCSIVEMLPLNRPLLFIWDLSFILPRVIGLFTVCLCWLIISITRSPAERKMLFL